jgi:spore germination protein KC
MKKINFINKIILLILLFMLNGCGQQSEIDRMLYVHVMGVDIVDDKYEVYVQIINLESKGGKSDNSSGGGGEQAIVGKVRGETVMDAIFNLYEAAQRKIFWGHLSSVIFSERFLKEKGIEGIQEVIEMIDRNRETRYTIWVLGTTSKLQDLLTTFPTLNLSPIFTKLGDPIENYRQSSLVMPIRLNHFIYSLTEPGGTAIIPLIRSVEKYWHSEKSTEGTLIVDGYIFIDKDGFKGLLKDENMAGLKWFQSQAERVYLCLCREDQPPIFLVFDDIKVKTKPQVKNDRATFTINVSVKGTVEELNQNVSKQFINEEAAKQIKEEIKRTYKKGLEMEADVYQLSEILYRKDPKAWKRLGFDKKFLLTEDSIQSLKVDAHIMESEKVKLEKMKIFNEK